MFIGVLLLSLTKANRGIDIPLPSVVISNLYICNKGTAMQNHIPHSQIGLKIQKQKKTKKQNTNVCEDYTIYITTTYTQYTFREDARNRYAFCKSQKKTKMQCSDCLMLFLSIQATKGNAVCVTFKYEIQSKCGLFSNRLGKLAEWKSRNQEVS